MSKLPLVLTFVSTNYLYQFMQSMPDYAVAHDRSFFQLSVIAFAFFVGLGKGESEK